MPTPNNAHQFLWMFSNTLTQLQHWCLVTNECLLYCNVTKIIHFSHRLGNILQHCSNPTSVPSKLFSCFAQVPNCLMNKLCWLFYLSMSICCLATKQSTSIIICCHLHTLGFPPASWTLYNIWTADSANVLVCSSNIVCCCDDGVLLATPIADPASPGNMLAIAITCLDHMMSHDLYITSLPDGQAFQLHP